MAFFDLVPLPHVKRSQPLLPEAPLNVQAKRLRDAGRYNPHARAALLPRAVMSTPKVPKIPRYR